MDRRRLSDVRAGTADHVRISGSGYLVGRRLVLTARHIVTDDVGTVFPRVEVWVGHPADGPRHRSLASIQWEDAAYDLALLHLDTVPSMRGSPVRWGWFVGSEPISYKGLCFPRFADYESGRGVEQLGGYLPPLAAGDGSGYILDQSTAPELGTKRAWGGASGAAVFCEDLLVGVVAKDDRDFANRRLHAIRIDMVLGDHDFARLVTEDTGMRPWIEAVELHTFLQPPAGTNLARTPGSLLAADIEAVDFTGREGIIDALTEWRDSDGLLGVSLILAEGGQGKTRLAREFAARSSTIGWVTGFIGGAADARREQQSGASVSQLGRLLRTSGRPILVIADYAETHPDNITAISDELLSYTPQSPVRLLLLSRTAGAWWDNMAETLPPENAQLIELSPLTDNIPDRIEAYARAVRGLARHLEKLRGYSVANEPSEKWTVLAGRLASHPPDLSDQRLRNALTLHMTALTDLLALGSGEVPRRLGKSEEQELIRHERGYLRRAAVRRGLFTQNILSTRTDRDDRAHEAWAALERSIAGLVLLGPCDLNRAHAISRLASSERIVDVVDWLARLYPPSTHRLRIGSVQPDRLAELLLGDILTRHAELLSEIASLVDGIDDAVAALLILLRTAAHPQFSAIAEQARDLVVRQPVPFFGAAMILATALAHAASIQGLESAVAALEAASSRAEPIQGADLSEALARAGNIVRARLALVRNASMPHTKRKISITDARQIISASATELPGHLYRELVEVSPDVLRDILEASLKILDVSYVAVTDQRQDVPELPSESVLVPGPTDEEVFATFSAIYSENYRSLVRFAALLDNETAEDAVQDSFVALADRYELLRPLDRDKMLSYLRQTVVNRARSEIRRRMSAERNVSELWPAEPSAEESAIASLEQETVVAALKDLPVNYREALSLYYYDGLSAAQIANAMGVSEKAVQAYMRRGRTVLRTRLSRYDLTP